MPTMLDKPLIRETGLKRDGHEVYVVLMPSEDGGVIAFKEKGKHGKGAEISLTQVMSSALGVEQTPAVVKPKHKVVTEQDEEAVDQVDLGTLESRLMIDANEQMTPEIKGVLWGIIRQIREERREDLGLPNLVRRSDRNQKQILEASKE